MSQFNGYELSRDWFDFCFDNPEKVKPVHTALYFFIIEHCNRVGWKRNFHLPTSMTMESIGIKNYATYGKALSALIEFGAIEMVEKSRNQYTANVIALRKIKEAHSEARNKALYEHSMKHCNQHCISIVCSTASSTVSINKPITINQEPITINQQTEARVKDLISSLLDISPEAQEEKKKKPAAQKEKKESVVTPTVDVFLSHAKELCQIANMDFSSLEYSLRAKYKTWMDDGWKDGHGKPIKNWKNKLSNTLPHLKPIHNGKQQPDYSPETVQAAFDEAARVRGL